MRARGWFRRAPGDRALAVLLRTAVGVAAVALAGSMVAGPASADVAAAGVAVLLAAPFAATLSAAVAHGRRGRRLDALLALALLATLLAGIWLGTL